MAQQLTSLLSPNSNLRSQVATLDSVINTLKASGLEDQADMFYSNIEQAIMNKDIDSLRAYSGQLMALSKENLKVPSDARKSSSQNVARSIEQLVSVADSRNIAIPPADLNAAARAFANKDQKSLSRIAGTISNLIDEGMKIQQNEQKQQVQLEDGSVALIGSQSGTRYDNTLRPIPTGEKNTQMFTSLASDAYSPKSKDVMSAMLGGSDLVGSSVIGAPMQVQPDIEANPEAYKAAQKAKETDDAIARRVRYNEEAKLLYDKGDRQGALNLLRALGAKDVGGIDLTDAGLDDYFKQVLPETSSASVGNPTTVPSEVQSPAATQEKPKVPLSGIFSIAPRKQ